MFSHIGPRPNRFEKSTAYDESASAKEQQQALAEQQAYESAYKLGEREGRLIGSMVRKDLEYQDSQKTLNEITDSAAVIARALMKSKESGKLDSKTGLFDYKEFVKICEQKTGHTRREHERERTHALLLCDLDSFKAINDMLGYQGADDTCLIPTAEIIKTSIREHDDVASRFGGEEFVVLLTDTDRDGAITVAGKIHDEVNNIRLSNSTKSNDDRLGICIGIATFGQGDDYVGAFNQANTALSEAKAQPGKNQILVFDEAQPLTA